MPTFFFTTTVKGGGKGSSSEVVAGLESDIAKAGGKPLSLETVSGSDSGVSKAAARPSSLAIVVIPDTGTAKAGAIPLSIERTRTIISVSVSGGGKSTSVEVVTLTANTNVKAGATPSSSDIGAGVETDNVNGAAKPLSITGVSISDTGSVKGGGLPLSSEIVRGREIDVVSGGATVSESFGFSAFNTGTVKAGGSASVTSSGHGTGSVVPVVLGAVPFICQPADFDYNALIEALRYNCALALPSVQIPESMENILEFSQITLPYLIINAGQPRADTSWAVNDMAQWIPVDFVYLAKEIYDSSTDETKLVRRKLQQVIQQAVKDYHEKANGVYVATMTELTASPMNKQNEYQMLFKERGEAVVAMVASMEFLVIASLVCE